MRIEEIQKGAVTILELHGKMVLGGGGTDLGEILLRLLDEGRKWFIFDMVKVPFMDSANLGEVVACYKRARERDGVIRLVLGGRVRSLFEMMELTKVFRVFADREEALASFLEQPVTTGG